MLYVRDDGILAEEVLAVGEETIGDEPRVVQVDHLLAPRIVQYPRLVEALPGRGHIRVRKVQGGRIPRQLGQEFGGYATAMAAHQTAIAETRQALRSVGLGGTAVGTGMNSHPDYRRLVTARLGDVTGESLVAAPDPFDAMQSMRPFAALSGALRTLCLDLIRICNDVRLLASGPRTGLAEISLPAVQPGSSIMPGKVNPVMAEMLTMVCFQVIGQDLTIAMAAQAGQLELNVMMPAIIYNILFSMEILKNAVYKLSESCIEGITANVNRCNGFMESSVGLVTVLAPYIGYAAAAEVAKESVRTGRSSKEIIMSRELLSPQALAEIIDPYPLTTPGIPGKRNE